MSDQWNDDDIVYIDPDARLIIGRVEWSNTGSPKPLERQSKDNDDDNEEKQQARARNRKKRYYPWGTYRTMKRLYRVAGKEHELESYRPLDEAMQLAMEEPYWD